MKKINFIFFIVIIISLNSCEKNNEINWNENYRLKSSTYRFLGGATFKEFKYEGLKLVEINSYYKDLHQVKEFQLATISRFTYEEDKIIRIDNNCNGSEFVPTNKWIMTFDGDKLNYKSDFRMKNDLWVEYFAYEYAYNNDLLDFYKRKEYRYSDNTGDLIGVLIQGHDFHYENGRLVQEDLGTVNEDGTFYIKSSSTLNYADDKLSSILNYQGYGTTYEYNYNNFGISSMHEMKGNWEIWTENYTYDANGNLINIVAIDDSMGIGYRFEHNYEYEKGEGNIDEVFADPYLNIFKNLHASISLSNLGWKSVGCQNK